MKNRLSGLNSLFFTPIKRFMGDINRLYGPIFPVMRPHFLTFGTYFAILLIC